MAAAYLRLGLQVGRLDRTVLVAYTGPAGLAAQAASGALPAPRELAARAEHLRSVLPAERLPDDRAAWLDAQLAALTAWCSMRDGVRRGHAELVEALHQVRPSYGDPQRYAAAHDELARVLPGRGPLAARYAAHLDRALVPPDRLEGAAHAVLAWLRRLTRERLGLPAGEHVALALVRGGAAGAVQTWRGRGRSEVALEAALPLPFGRLVRLLAHECYPGHHTERVRKQVALADRPEAALSLACTPESTVAEGLAEVALRGVGLGRGWGAAAQEVAEALGLAYDGRLDEAVVRAAAPLAPARQDAALLLHVAGADRARAQAHLQRWLLLPPERAARQAAFAARHPAYSSTYVEGERLVGSWLDRQDDEPAAFAVLLDGQHTPAGLRRVARAAPGAGRVAAAGGDRRPSVGPGGTAPVAPPGRPGATA